MYIILGCIGLDLMKRDIWLQNDIFVESNIDPIIEKTQNLEISKYITTILPNLFHMCLKYILPYIYLFIGMISMIFTIFFFSSLKVLYLFLNHMLSKYVGSVQVDLKTYWIVGKAMKTFTNLCIKNIFGRFLYMVFIFSKKIRQALSMLICDQLFYSYFLMSKQFVLFGMSMMCQKIVHRVFLNGDLSPNLGTSTNLVSKNMQYQCTHNIKNTENLKPIYKKDYTLPW